MKIAFDWGGVLSDSLTIRKLAISLLNAGHKVFVISVAKPDERRDWHIEKSGINFTGVHTIIDHGTTDHGEETVRAMKGVKCRMMFSDNPSVVETVRARGMLGFHVVAEREEL